MKKNLIIAGIACCSIMISHAQQSNRKNSKPTVHEEHNDIKKAKKTEGPGFDAPQYDNNQLGEGTTEIDERGRDDESHSGNADNANQRGQDASTAFRNNPVSNLKESEDKNKAPILIEATESGAGSPAIKSEGRDGTNTMQRAKPNMAGSPVTGLHTGRAAADVNEETKKGSAKQAAIGVSDKKSERKTEAPKMKADKQPAVSKNAKQDTRKVKVQAMNTGGKPAVKDEKRHGRKKSKKGG
jgi:hypothetical protein